LSINSEFIRLRITGDDDDIPTYDYILMQQVASEVVDNAKKLISNNIAVEPSPLPKAIQDIRPEPSPEPSPLPSPLPSPDKKAEKICNQTVVAASDNSELKSEQSTGDGRGDGSGDGSEPLSGKESDGCDGSTAILSETISNQSRGFKTATVKLNLFNFIYFTNHGFKTTNRSKRSIKNCQNWRDSLSG